MQPCGELGVFCLSACRRLRRSADAGQTWALVHPEPSTVTGVRLISDHASETILHTGTPQGAVLALAVDPADSRTLYAAFREGARVGLFLSADWGAGWQRLADLPGGAREILVDPGSEREERMLYVTGFGRGLFKSTDGGASWTLKNSGLAGGEPFAWRLAQDQEGGLYVVVARRTEDGSFGNAGDGALCRSTDGAESWSRIELPRGVNGPNGLAIDPEDPRRLYLAAWGRRASTGDVDGGIFLSTDCGATWSNVLARDQHIYDVTIDPRDPKVLYACGFSSSAWRSTDRGQTWERIRGYNFKWGHRVVPDPANALKIYITTFGGSVWHGPAAGDPDAVEDIVTPALAHAR
jgi:photosystem II stability/assembly factor-like uncharacterized protein